MEHWEPILVVGTGRSGTSAAARLLHERLGVCMGSRFRAPDETNALGFYEDLDFRDANQARLEGQVTPKQWDREIERLLIDRRARDQPWGWKDPRTAHFLSSLGAYMRLDRVVLCRRPLADVVDSMWRCYGWTQEEAHRLARTRELLLENVKPRVVIDLADKPSEEDVVRLLQEVL